MNLHLPPIGEIFRPAPEIVAIDDTTVPEEPSRQMTRIVNRGFADLFSTMAGSDVRTKPSYTDCWMVDVGELDPVASYMTDMGTVMIGNSENGETIYHVTPREYAYPDDLNAIVMDVIKDVRSNYRKNGGSLDRDAVIGMTRSLLTDRWTEIREVTGTDDPDSVVKDVCNIVYRHSVGAGVFEVLLSDGHIEDVYLDAPCSENRIHVTLNGVGGLNSHMRCSTNLMAEEREIDNLLNILKRHSGLRFCRTNPVIETDMRGFDARATIIGYPLSPMGNAVALRKHSVRPWTLTRLIANGTVTPRTAGILSFLVNSRATFLVCGARGAGKSSLLSALMFEFPINQRILTIEDTMELPGELMRKIGYKVQSILVDERIQGSANSRADEALRVSLRLGESAIVMGEVRGEEARTLYQSMRAGRAGSAILGTVHGDSASSVYQRMVYNMGIPPEAFMATDVLVTLGTVRDRGSGCLIRKVSEFVSTGKEPGDFIDISSPNGFMSSPVANRILRSMGNGRVEILKEIRARSAMRSYLSGLASRDERYLGPEWIVIANEVLAGMRGTFSAEDAVKELERRVEGDGD